jgi:hypothetical protein
MDNRISIFLILISAGLFLAGCGEPVRPPEIRGPDERFPRTSPIDEGVTVPDIHTFTAYPPAWIPPKISERKWIVIVIHHSATDKGNMAGIDSNHRNVKGWDGIGYDFVIGNGRGSGDGQVEVTYRWLKQVTGAHCGGTPDNWANEYGIGICLIGDFTKTQPTYRQMVSLQKLVRFLKDRYKIPESRIYGHQDVPGYTRGSVCPGKYFPMGSFKRSL